MTEFRVDKLGWYETSIGVVLQVVYKLNDDEFVYIMYDRPYVVFSNGTFFQFPFVFVQHKLIKYLGPELPELIKPKEPRKFQFASELLVEKRDRLQ